MAAAPPPPPTSTTSSPPSSSTSASDTECSICHEPFRDPRVLLCGHELCSQCLITLLTAHPRAPCPLCRCPILPPDWGKGQAQGQVRGQGWSRGQGQGQVRGQGQGQALGGFVNVLPKDASMEVWVECERLLGEDHDCQSCLTQAASSLCLHCRDFLCAACTAQHGRLSSSRHHRVESLTTLTALTLASTHSALCQQHPAELSTLYCDMHRAFICMLCAKSTHRSCQAVKDVEERAAEILTLLTETMTALADQEGRLDQALQRLDTLDTDTGTSVQAAEDEVDTAFDHLDSMLTRLRRVAKKSARSRFEPVRTALQTCRADLVQQRGAVTTHRAIVDRGRGMVTSGKMADMAQALSARAKDICVPPTMPALPAIANGAAAALTVNSPAVAAVEKALNDLEIGIVAKGDNSADLQKNEFIFHTNCGKNVKLSNGGRSAERKGDDNGGGIVIGCLPMETNKLYEVYLDVVESGGLDCMAVGVVPRAPDSLPLPHSASRWPQAVVFMTSCVDTLDKRTRSYVGRKLWKMPAGSRVGVMLDDTGSVHLFIDGQDQGIAGSSIPRPCYPFFDVCFGYRKVTVLPVTTVP